LAGKRKIRREKLMTTENQAQEAEKGHLFGNKYLWILGIVIALAIASNVIMYIWFTSPERIGVAEVNGEVITKDEFIKAIIAQNGQSALDWIIENKLIYQEAKKEGISVSDEEIESRMSEIRSSFGSQESFLSILSLYGLTEEAFKEQLIPRMLAEKIIMKDKDISDKDLIEFFAKNKSSFDEKEQVKLRHILLKTLEEAQQAEEELRNGKDFGTLAKEMSIDTATSSNGGEMGWVGKGVLDPALEKVVFSLNKGERTSVVKTSFGYEIAEVLDKKAARSVTFEEVKDRVKEAYIEDIVQQNYSDWVQGLKSVADIKYYISPGK